MARILVVFHPCSGRRNRQGAVDAIGRGLAAGGHDVERIETVAAARDDGRVRAGIGRGPWDHVVAAGGDGTVRDVAEALLEIPVQRRPPLAIVPHGTANNAARSIDPTLRRRGKDPAGRLLDTLARPQLRRVDAGVANGRVFLGSVAMGMDADILAWRNTNRARCPSALAGYPLYLASCAVNAFRTHGGEVLATMEGRAWEQAPAPAAVNVLVTNTALHAGEFRFAAGERHDDGLLDVVWNPTMGDYLRRYAAAWPRHVRAVRSLSVREDAGLRTTQALTLQWQRPVAWQVDGEEMAPSDRFEISVVRDALAVLVPASA